MLKICGFNFGIGDDFRIFLDQFWEVGNKRPEIAHYDETAKIPPIIIEVDGEELQFIERNFRNLPIPLNTHNRKVIWTGEMARFILENLVPE